MIALPKNLRVVAGESTAEEKEFELRRLMREFGRVLVAYSGGVDSTYLAFIGKSELGENADCVMGDSPSVGEFQREQARDSAASGGFNFALVKTFEMDDRNYVANGPDRCYFCKNELYQQLISIAAQRNNAVVVDGTNADDILDHRPGRHAADELGVRSPLAEVGLSKDEIRERSRYHGLRSWDRPASPCLSSRIAHGAPVTIEKLWRVEAAEKVLRGEGFIEFRVRIHKDLARIELARNELDRALDLTLLDKIQKKIKDLGFKYVTLDLEGFRSGSMNEVPGPGV
jgi:pyridinium-3,5-biscarboxylic acid mononucleotide sulfurtransferase